MNLFILNIILAFTWIALIGSFSLESLAIGFILGYGVLLFAGPILGKSNYQQRAKEFVVFIGLLVWELLLANLQVALRVVTPRHKMHPRVIAIPVEEASDIELTTLAHLITLTPGSLSLDFSRDRKLLFIHVIHAPDPEKKRVEIKNSFERRVLSLYRGEPHKKVET